MAPRGNCVREPLILYADREKGEVKGKNIDPSRHVRFVKVTD